MDRIEDGEWTLVIRSRHKGFSFNISDLWRYRDLVMLFVRRDFIAVYKQTILGPLWFILQPVITTVLYTLVFTNIANIPTDGIPPLVFYLSGIVAWTYFADCLNKTSTTFVANAGIFGKVYFPRLVVPVSIVISNLIKFFIQYVIFLGFYLYYYFQGTYQFAPNMYIFLTPVLMLVMAGMGLGFGLLISSMATKYRDLTFLIGFGVQLLMYATPVIYPLSFIPDKYKAYIMLNPMTNIIETFRYGYLGQGEFHPAYFVYSICFMLVLLTTGMMLFNRVERNFMDTV
jgi:lipopolysaccharide transport system permease protein